MNNIFHQIPATLYVAPLTALATLAGVAITNRATYSRLQLKLEYEQKEKQRERLLSKLEDLYLLVTQWSYGEKRLNSCTLSWLEGKSSTEEFKKEIESELHIDYHAVDMLIHIYFPSLSADYEKLMALKNEILSLVFGYQVILSSGEEHSAEQARILKILQALHADHAKQSEALKETIAEQTSAI